MSAKQLTPSGFSWSTNSSKSAGTKGGYVPTQSSNARDTPLLNTEETEERSFRRRSSLENLEAFDQQYEDKKLFYGGITVLFFISAIFAHITGLYAHHAEGPISVGMVLSSYVKFIPCAFVLQKVAGMTLSAVLVGGFVVGIFWSLVQENGGHGVNLSVDSMTHAWQWYHFVGFGVLFAAVLKGIKYRYDEVKQNGSWAWKDASDLYWSVVGIVLVVFAKIAGAKVHLHHWFIGFALTLATARLGGLPGFLAKTFFFGLFLHGAACWGFGDIFQENVVTTTTLAPFVEETETYVPILFMVGIVATFFGAKYTGRI